MKPESRVWKGTQQRKEQGKGRDTSGQPGGKERGEVLTGQGKGMQASGQT